MYERRRGVMAGVAGLVVMALALGANADTRPRGFFSCPVVVFFAPCPTIEDTPGDAVIGSPRRPRSSTGPPQSGPPPVASLWAEPRAGTEARGQVYVPPGPVREFLEAPTPERARAYLVWNQARLRAIAQAAEALRLVSGSDMTEVGDTPAPATGGPAEGCVAPATVGAVMPTAGSEDPLASVLGAAADPRGASRGVTVLYAFASWCPDSARQTPLLAAWARSRPEVPVTGLLLDSAPGATTELAGLPFPVRAGSRALRDRLGVRRYPTLLVFKDGVPVERLAGLTSAARLEAVIRALGV